MYKKIDFDEEIIRIRENGISSYSGYKTQSKIIVTDNKGELAIYYFTNTNEYSDFNSKLRRIYQEQRQ